MTQKCSTCKVNLTKENSSPSVFKSGYGRCRKCENERQKIRSRTLGGRFIRGSTQAKFNKHKWKLSFQQYAATIASDKCFYCDGPLPEAAGGLDREASGDYTWNTVLPCCSKYPRSKGPRRCNEIKSGDFSAIVFFAHKWYEKFGKLPSEQDFREKLKKYKMEREKTYKILCSLSPQEIKKLKQHTSVKEFLATLGY